jgi:hypothetical protein
LLLFHQLSVLLATHYVAGLDWRRLLLLLLLIHPLLSRPKSTLSL